MQAGQARLLLFVLLVAGGLGFLMGRSTAPEPEAGPDPVDAPRPDRPAPPVELPPGSLAEALAAIQVERVEGGDGEITGVVKTRDGEPLEGVRIIAASWRTRSGPGVRLAPGQVPEDPDLEETVVELIRDRQFRRSSRVEAVTGPDGRFRLTGIADRRYGVRAYCSGYRIHTKNGNAGPGDEVNFEARLVAVLSLRVLSPDGQEAPGARVEAKDPNGGRSSIIWSDTNRTMEVRPGRYVLTAVSKDSDAKSDPVEMSTGGGETIVLRLKTVPGVRGRVVVPEGGQVRGAWVYVRRWSKAEDPTAREVRRGGKGVVPWSHRFVLPDLGKGKWFLALVIDDRIVDSARIEVGDGMVEQDLTVPAPDPKDFLVVTVEGPDGKPVPQASFSVGHRHADGNSSRGCRTLKLGNGRFRIPHFVLEDEREYTDPEFYVRVMVSTLGEQSVVYDPGTTREMTVRFDAPALLTIRIPNVPDGWLGETLRVALKSAADRPGSSSNRDGRVEDPKTVKCRPVIPGEYTVRLSLRAEMHGFIPLVEKAVTLVAGKQEEALDLPPLYRTTIVMPEGMKKRQVRLGPAKRSDGDWSSSVTAKEGRVELPELPAGQYQVSLFGGRMEGPMVFTRPGPAVLHFKPAVLNAMRISITKPEGTLGKAGFRDGDLIIGAHGKLFENIQQASAAIMSGGKEGVPLIVLRGERRIDLTVDFTPLFKSGDKKATGGDLDPATRPE